MMRPCQLDILVLAIAAVGAAGSGLAQAQVLEIRRLGDIWPAISRCWNPPAGSPGMEITLRFSFKRNGEILGEPRITYAKLHGSTDAQRDFRNSVLAAVRDCTPLNLSDELGGAIAGRPISIRFIAPGGASARLGAYFQTFSP